MTDKSLQIPFSEASADSEMSSYEIIASSSGGEIYVTDNVGIRALSRLIEGDIRASKVFGFEYCFVYTYMTEFVDKDKVEPENQSAQHILPEELGQKRDGQLF